MAKFSSMFDRYQSRDTIISCSSSSAVLGHSATRTEPASRRPSRALRAVDFGRAARIRYRRRTLVIQIGLLMRLLRLLGTLQGMPESLRVSEGLQLLSGITRLELGLIRNLMRMMMMIEILKRMVHNLIRPMYD